MYNYRKIEYYIIQNILRRFIFQNAKLHGKPKRPPSAFILYMLSMMKTQKPTINNKVCLILSMFESPFDNLLN